MFGKKNLIFLVDDNKAYGNMIKATLNSYGYLNVQYFNKEMDFLNSLDQYPNVVVCDYNLTDMSGLQLIKRAKEEHPLFYSILLSGEFHENIDNYFDPRFIHLIDKYLIKGMNEVDELINSLQE